MSDVALKFKSMRTTHRYSSDWLAWFLTQHADWYGEKCWLFLPKGAKDATGRIVLVAHIDTVHDGYRRGIVKSTKVEIPVKEEEKTFAERKVADVADNDRSAILKSLEGFPNYIRKINGLEYECWETKNGEWRRKRGSTGADAFTWYEGWGVQYGHTIRKAGCAGFTAIVGRESNRYGRHNAPDEDEWLNPKVKFKWVDKVCEPEKKYHDRPVYYDAVRKVMWSPEGLGADDRAGVWAIWRIFREMYDDPNCPAILFCDYEEKGGQGATEACEILKKQLGDMLCFVEFDRKGVNDAVYYCDEPKKWRKLWRKAGFEDSHGSFSDVAYLGKEFLKCTVNLSVGYINHHTKSEMCNKEYALASVNKVIKAVPTIVDHGRWHNKAAKSITRGRFYTGPSVNSRAGHVYAGQVVKKDDGDNGKVKEAEIPTKKPEYLPDSGVGSDLGGFDDYNGYNEQYWEEYYAEAYGFGWQDKWREDMKDRALGRTAGIPEGCTCDLDRFTCKIHPESTFMNGYEQEPEHISEVINQIKIEGMEHDLNFYCPLCTRYFGEAYKWVATEGCCPHCGEMALDLREKVEIGGKVSEK